MKKFSLLILLCCAYNINIFGAENKNINIFGPEKKKESIAEKQDRAARELIEYLNKQECEQKEKDRKKFEQKQKDAEIHNNKIIKRVLEDKK
jgi:hypothetical protein